jgi:hypothetical protein
MAGDVLTELKSTKPASKIARSSHCLHDLVDMQAVKMESLPVSSQGPKLAGHILADLRAAQTRHQGFNEDESTTTAPSDSTTTPPQTPVQLRHAMQKTEGTLDAHW